MTKFNLEELMNFMDKKPKIKFLIPNGKEFSKHYSMKRDNIIKLEGWGLHDTGITKKPKDMGFAEFRSNSGEFVTGALKIPYKILSKLGYKEGDYIDRILIYAEHENKNLKFYVANYPRHQISKKEQEKIIKEIDEALPDRYFE